MFISVPGLESMSSSFILSHNRVPLIDQNGRRRANTEVKRRNTETTGRRRHQSTNNHPLSSSSSSTSSTAPPTPSSGVPSASSASSLMSNRKGGGGAGDYQEVIESLRRSQLIFEEDENAGPEIPTVVTSSSSASSQRSSASQHHRLNNMVVGGGGRDNEMSNNQNGNTPSVTIPSQCQVMTPRISSPSSVMAPSVTVTSGTVQQGKTFARIQGSSPSNTTHSTPTVAQAMQSVAPHIPIVGAGADDSSAEILSVFECPVCLEYMLPPYMQCPSGHLVCSNCRPKLQCCPTCRGPTPSVRNLGLEKIANTVRFPCKFSNSGCPLNFHHIDKMDHEELCEYRPYSCPCPGASCKWQGALADVMDHLKKVHKSITTLQGEDIVFLATDINLPGAVDWVMMQSCFDYNFMLVLEKQEKYDPAQSTQMFYAVVQLIGSKKEADNFVYRLELSANRRRMSWEATPRSIHEGVAFAIQQSDCLAFDTSAAQLFAENGNLGINVTISRIDGQQRRHPNESDAVDVEYD
ncbi:hypothetical protein L3Y34_005190 [Caenorhabditis briggsae]|uniref:E3 ubiquitin-protein ligase n=1 Tax=Caenorhabditis briggsae TaxID=6238 RepID=A0AAE9AHA2_CAEBR|nr:hypothetical protein L3Y34_005190 [Caenorhabditis briggsae]